MICLRFYINIKAIDLTYNKLEASNKYKEELFSLKLTFHSYPCIPYHKTQYHSPKNTFLQQAIENHHGHQLKSLSQKPSWISAEEFVLKVCFSQQKTHCTTPWMEVLDLKRPAGLLNYRYCPSTLSYHVIFY